MKNRANTGRKLVYRGCMRKLVYRGCMRKFK